MVIVVVVADVFVAVGGGGICWLFLEC